MVIIVLFFTLAKQRILTAQKSLVTLPKIGNNERLSDDQTDGRERKKSGLMPPPPSRVSSFGKLANLDIVAKLNEYVFDEEGLLSDTVSSSDAMLDEEDEEVAEENMLCFKDDDGLILKLERNSSAIDPDDYGSELLIIPDAACDAFIIGKPGGPVKRKRLSDSWDEFIEITGVDI